MESRFTEDFLKRDKALFDTYLETFVKKFNTKICYGTAGFRIEAKYLEHIAFRVGVFGAYFAAYAKGAIGVQITASHNPPQDNGIKLIGRDGLMMKTNFEKPVEEFANMEDLREACKYLDNFFAQLNNGQPLSWEGGAFALIGCDTRPSSPGLMSALREGFTYMGAKFIDFGEITTPQLHYTVMEFNKQYAKDLPYFDYDPKALLNGYYKHFGGTLLEVFDLLADMGLHDKNKRKKTFVDCSNGVGGIHQEKLNNEYFNKVFDCVVYNSNEVDLLNVDCGSEFVQKEKKVPKNLLELVDQHIPADVNLDTISFISYDGDADRSVAYRITRGCKEADLFEGDKIGALYALFVQRTLTKVTELQIKLKDVVDLKEDFTKWTIGSALTAYANGSAQKFYKDVLKVAVMMEPTGVKYLHKAAEQFDIGVYFESNGHGNILYNPEKIRRLRDAVQIAYENLGKSEAHKDDLLALYQHVKLLYLFLVEANQGVGDAISNYIQIETALAALGLDATGWKNIYTDLQSAHSKIKVKNRLAIQCTYDQTRVTSPPEIQPNIDEICSKYEMGRAFLRPSGTEDIVRCYVEATKPEDIQEIQKQIHEIVLNDKTIN